MIYGREGLGAQAGLTRGIWGCWGVLQWAGASSRLGAPEPFLLGEAPGLSSKVRGHAREGPRVGGLVLQAHGSATPREAERAGWDLRGHLDAACWVRRGN